MAWVSGYRLPPVARVSPAARTRVRAALHVGACDQTFSIDLDPDDAPVIHTLLVAWIGPYARLMPDEALDLVADALMAEGWRPFDGPVAAQRAFAHWERKNTRRPTTPVS